MMQTTTMTQHDMGNNETFSTGIAKQGDEFIALTGTDSRWFKTYKGAARWLAARGYAPNGERIN